MKRRLEIARGLIHRPEILFLDEPTTGLDPQTRARTWEVLRALRRDFGTTLFLTTHYMDEAENCDRIAIIDHGKIVALDTPAALKQRVGKDLVTARSADPEALARAAVREVRHHQHAGRRRAVVPGRGGRRLHRQAADRRDRPALGGISVRRPTLDDVFLSLTGRQIREEGAEGQFARLRAHRAEARLTMLEVVYALWRRDMVKFLRDRRSLITSLVRPFLWLLAFGFGLRASVKLPGRGRRLRVVPGAGDRGDDGAVLEHVRRHLDRLGARVRLPQGAAGGARSRAAPSSRPSCWRAAPPRTVEAALMLALSPLIGARFSVAGALASLPLLAVFGMAVNALGIVVAARMKSFEGFGSVVNFVIQPIFFLSGALYPIDGLPRALRVVVLRQPDVVRRRRRARALHRAPPLPDRRSTSRSCWPRRWLRRAGARALSTRWRSDAVA